MLKQPCHVKTCQTHVGVLLMPDFLKIRVAEFKQKSVNIE